MSNKHIGNFNWWSSIANIWMTHIWRVRNWFGMFQQNWPQHTIALQIFLIYRQAFVSMKKKSHSKEATLKFTMWQKCRDEKGWLHALKWQEQSIKMRTFSLVWGMFVRVRSHFIAKCINWMQHCPLTAAWSLASGASDLHVDSARGRARVTASPFLPYLLFFSLSLFL